MLFGRVRHPGHQARDHDIVSQSGANSQICLECAAILRHQAVNDPVSAWGYTRAMMIKRILTVLATVAAGTAGTSLALAQVYPQAPGSTYSRDPNYPPGGYPADYRDGREAAPDSPTFLSFVLYGSPTLTLKECLGRTDPPPVPPPGPPPWLRSSRSA